MNIRIAFETDEPLPQPTFTWEQMEQQDGLYEIAADEKGWVHWAILTSDGHGCICVTAKDGNCVLQRAQKATWGHLRFVKSKGRLVISN